MKSLSLKFKLYFLSLSLIGLTIVTGVIGHFISRDVLNSYEFITGWNVPARADVTEMMLHLRQARVRLILLLVPGTPTEMDLLGQKEIKENWQEFDEHAKQYENIDFKGMTWGVGEKEIYDKFKENVEIYRKQFAELIHLYDISDEGTPERRKAVEFLIGPMDVTAREIYKWSQALQEYHDKSMATNIAEAGEKGTRGNVMLAITLLVGISVALAFVYFFASSLVKTLRSVATSLSEAGLQVSSAAEQIASSSQGLSQASTEQAASLEETAASIEEMSGMVGKNSENAKNSSELSRQSLDNVHKGKGAVDDMIKSMDEINASNNQIAEIVKLIREIDTKTKVINDIVFQTKLLSFNASVEAARAGEHGKGFAVVAEEVGNLAQMSGSAAEEISTLLDSSIQKVEGIVEVTKSKVDAGAVNVQRCGELLDDILRSVDDVNKMSSDIAAASQEQAQGVQEITKAMSQLDQVTQQNAATSEETASAAEELSAQSGSLNSVVDLLLTVVDGGVQKQPLVQVKNKKEQSVKKSHQASSGAKVVSLASKRPAPLKKASGGNNVPDHTDPRFKDI